MAKQYSIEQARLDILALSFDSPPQPVYFVDVYGSVSQQGSFTSTHINKAKSILGTLPSGSTVIVRWKHYYTRCWGNGCGGATQQLWRVLTVSGTTWKDSGYQFT